MENFDQVFCGGFFLRPSKNGVRAAEEALHLLGAAHLLDLATPQALLLLGHPGFDQMTAERNREADDPTGVDPRSTAPAGDSCATRVVIIAPGLPAGASGVTEAWSAAGERARAEHVRDGRGRRGGASAGFHVAFCGARRGGGADLVGRGPDLVSRGHDLVGRGADLVGPGARLVGPGRDLGDAVATSWVQVRTSWLGVAISGTRLRPRGSRCGPRRSRCPPRGSRC